MILSGAKTLSDLNTNVANGPEWLGWVIIGLFAVYSVVALAGHGANLIAGYNTATEEEKKKYDKKKLSRVVGAGFAFLTVILFVMFMWETVIPIGLAYVLFALIAIDIIVMLILMATICKVKDPDTSENIAE